MLDNLSRVFSRLEQPNFPRCAFKLFLFRLIIIAVLFSLFSVLFQNLEFIIKMLNRCSGKQGRGCSRFLTEWDNHLLCHSCRDCSQDNPCDACSDLSTLTWSKSIKAISKLSRQTNLDKTEEKVQTEGASRMVTRLLLSPTKRLVMWKFPPSWL